MRCSHWLSWRVSLGLKAAREHVRVARALGSLPKLDEVSGRGEISYSKVRAITRVATPQTEQDFIDVAAHATASQIERLARSYRNAVARADISPQSQQQREESRFVRRSAVAGGMVRIEIQLPPEEAGLGPTKLSNLILVCPAHHRMIHEGVLDVVLGDGQPRFIQAATKRELRAVPASVATGAELDELEGWLDASGLELSPEVNAPRWDGAPMRLAETIDWMLQAHPASSSP